MEGGRVNEYIGYWVHIISEKQWSRKPMTEKNKPTYTHTHTHTPKK